MTKIQKARLRKKAGLPTKPIKMKPPKKLRRKNRDIAAITQSHALEAVIILQRAKTADPQTRRIYVDRYDKLIKNQNFSPLLFNPQLPHSIPLTL